MVSFIIIEHEPLTERLNKIWNIEGLLSKGVNVEYWDISQLIYTGIDIPGTLSRFYVRQIFSLESLTKNISKIDVKKTIFAVEFFQNWENRDIWSLLYEYNCKCIHVDLYANTNLGPVFKRNWLDYISPQKILSIYKRIKWKIYKYLFLKDFKVQLISSSNISSPDFFINHPDYEQFKYEESCSIITSYKYAVFIDTYYPLHPDLSFYFGIKVNAEDVDVYRETMSSFFDVIEKKNKVKVVIAAHPKSKYLGGEFGNRDIIKGNTCNLIKHSELVITHESNSLSYIALANKPFVIVYPRSYKKYEILYRYILNMAKLCKKEVYEIESCIEGDFFISPLDEKMRQDYINTFLTSTQTQDKLNVDILNVIINSLLAKN